MSLITELRRRNVIRVGIAYAVTAWLLIQIADILFEAFTAPDWALRALVTVLLIGLPLALLLTWVFEWTPEGLKRESALAEDDGTRRGGRRLDRLIIVVLALALGYFAIDKFVLRQDLGPGANERAASAELSAPARPAPPSGVVFDLPQDASVAVLPLEDLSLSDASATFAAGIHADLLTQLARNDALRVISKTSVERFIGSELSVREIAGRLNAATVLEGGVQRAGDQVRISLQLVDAATDSTLWAEAFDRRLTTDNVFAIQREIANAVAAALDATLAGQSAVPTASEATPTDDLVALDLYFEGQALMERRTVASLEAARARFTEALERDPDFALALTGQAQSILLLSDEPGAYGDIPLGRAVAMALPLLERSLSLAPQEPQTLAVYGNALVDARRVEEGLDHLRRSLELNPSSGEVLNWYALSLERAGRFREANEVKVRMVNVDPASELTLYNAAVSLANWDGLQPEFVDTLLRRLELLSPARAAAARAGIARSRGAVVDAVLERYRSLALDPERVANRRALSSTLLTLGLVEEARRLDDRDFDLRLASTTGDWPRMLELVREDFKERASEPEIAGGLAMALYANRRIEDALALALQLWDATGRDPWWYGTANLLNTALGMRALEDDQRAEEFLAQGRRTLQARIDAGLGGSDLQMDQALLAMIEGRQADAVAHLARAIDLGERWRAGFELPAWDPIRDVPGFLAELQRLERLIADERRQVRDLLCGPEPVLPAITVAPGTCGPLEG